MTMPALFAVESGASVKQVQPPVIQGKRQDETLLGMILFCPSTQRLWGGASFLTNAGQPSLSLETVNRLPVELVLNLLADIPPLLIFRHRHQE